MEAGDRLHHPYCLKLTVSRIHAIVNPICKSGFHSIFNLSTIRGSTIIIFFCRPQRHKEKETARRERWRNKEERLRKKERKLRRKAKMEKECLSERMNCFNHDNDHWRTPPLWTSGPFCFCMNANNNTYSCLRTINATHNFLYCEFVTGLITYYNLRLGEYLKCPAMYSTF